MTDYQLRAAKRLQESIRSASGYAPPSKIRRLRKRTRPIPPDLWRIANEVMAAVGNCIPDCDPLEVLAPKLERMGVERCDVTRWLDRAVRKHLACSSYNRYLIDAWDGWNEVCEPDQRMPNPWK